jgi:hypothetical protein
MNRPSEARSDSKRLGPTDTPSMKMAAFYAAIAFLALCLAGVAAWFIVERLELLAHFMAIGQAYFVLLVIMSLGAGAFLFGAMKSYGKITGHGVGAAFGVQDIAQHLGPFKSTAISQDYEPVYHQF